MPKILLFRVPHDLSARLVSELSRAGYEAAAPESADVRTVLQHEPDLILLQTDVRTLDCCGLLTQLKGNEATASVLFCVLPLSTLISTPEPGRNKERGRRVVRWGWGCPTQREKNSKLKRR